MDIRNPIRSLAPSVEGDVLAVLVRSHDALTGLRVKQLAGRSYGQVREVLHRLVSHGLVDAERYGQSVAYSLNREHVLAAAVEMAFAAGDEVERRLRTAFEAWQPPPMAAVLFGSFARRDGDPRSDIDLLLVRPDEVAEEDEAWTARRYDVSRRIERWTGNHTQVVELTSAELSDAVARNDELVVALRSDGHVLLGPPLRTLLRS